MREDLKKTRKSLYLFRKFPHRIAGEYPEEWLVRILDALSTHVREQGLLSGAGDREISLTLQYTADYLKVAQSALRETMEERKKFVAENAVLTDSELRGEIEFLKERCLKLEMENKLLADLVRAKSPAAFRAAEGALRGVAGMRSGATPLSSVARPCGLTVFASTARRQQGERERLAMPKTPVQELLADLDNQQFEDSSAT